MHIYTETCMCLTNHDELIYNPATPIKSIVHINPHPPTLGELARRDSSKQVCERQHSKTHYTFTQNAFLRVEHRPGEGPSG